MLISVAAFGRPAGEFSGGGGRSGADGDGRPKCDGVGLYSLLTLFRISCSFLTAHEQEIMKLSGVL